MNPPINQALQDEALLADLDDSLALLGALEGILHQAGAELDSSLVALRSELSAAGLDGAQALAEAWDQLDASERQAVTREETLQSGTPPASAGKPKIKRMGRMV